MHDRPVVPDDGTEYEENPSSHHGGMLEDGLTDRLTDGMDPFLYSLILLSRSGK